MQDFSKSIEKCKKDVLERPQLIKDVIVIESLKTQISELLK